MIILPPFFSYILFFIIDSLALIFYLFFLTSPLGAVVNFFGNILYYAISLVKYGAKKTVERHFNLKVKPRSKILKFIGSSLIPYTHIWMVYSDYKEDLKEGKAKEAELDIKRAEIQQAQIETVAQNINNIKNTKINEEVRVDNSENNVGNEIKSKEDQAIGIDNADENGQAIDNPWMISNKSKKEMKNKETTLEEVGGIKTGLNREDYDIGTDYSKMKTYEDLVKEKENKKKEEERKQEEENKKRRIQGLKSEQSLRKELLERSKLRFGKKAKEGKRFEDKYRESLEES